jgi:hypothetical protein
VSLEEQWESADAPPSEPADVNGVDCVRQITVAYVDSITPEGVEVPLTPGLATVYHYDTGYPGDDAWEVVPPDLRHQAVAPQLNPAS